MGQIKVKFYCIVACKLKSYVKDCSFRVTMYVIPFNSRYNLICLEVDTIRQSEYRFIPLSVRSNDKLCNCTVEIHLRAVLTKISIRVRLFYDCDDVNRHIGAASTAFGRLEVRLAGMASTFPRKLL